MGKLDGKVALITGGNSGIGLATAKRFVQEGAYVFITGRTQLKLDEAVKQVGSNVTGVQGDVAKLADLDRLFDQIKKDKGKLDIVFANAGIAKYAPLGTIDEEHFDSIFGANVKGLLFTVQKAAASAARRGIHYSQRVGSWQQRTAGKQRLLRDQGGGALFRPHLDH